MTENKEKEIAEKVKKIAEEISRIMKECAEIQPGGQYLSPGDLLKIMRAVYGKAGERVMTVAKQCHDAGLIDDFDFSDILGFDCNDLPY